MSLIHPLISGEAACGGSLNTVHKHLQEPAFILFFNFYFLIALTD